MDELEWDVDVLNLEAYLDRIGHTGPLDRSAATVAALHRAHLAAIPFENFDVMLGRGVSVDLADIQAKLVVRRRGGYCYEHGLLFAAVLQQLGYRVDRLLARVGNDLTRPRPRTHMVLAVTAEATRGLADVGFGSGLLEPIPLRPDIPISQGPWTYRLTHPDGDPDIWLLQERTEGSDWTTQYSFAAERQHLSDVRMANHYTSTWPESPFVRQAALVRKDEHEIRRLLGRQLTHVRPGAPDKASTVSDTDYAATLRELGVDLDPADIDALIATLPPAELPRTPAVPEMREH